MATAQTLQSIIGKRAELEVQRAERVKAHNQYMAASTAALVKLNNDEALIVAGIDLERAERGRAIIDVRGRVSDVRRGFDGNGAGIRAAMLAEAKADLALGGERIASRYFGVKNYDGFGDQRTDCEYGMGPRHGSIVCSIGLTRTLRDRIRSGPHLEDSEIEDALYLLSALPAIEAALADRKAA
jgi:hypothetical protein